MKSPSKNISQSLRGQRAPGRAPLEVPAPEMQKRGVSMIIPGMGGIEEEPTTQHPRSVAKYCGPQRRYGGG